MIIVLLFIIWRMILFFIVNISPLFVKLQPNFLGRGFDTWHHSPVLWNWANFDGEHYLSIASGGYKQFEYAFFPGFPGLIQLVDSLFKNLLLTGFLISNVLSFVLLLLLFKLFSLDFKQQTVIKGLVLFLCFPAAFFLGSVYSESLFLCLVVGSLLSARKQLFLLASALAVFACFTRLVGIFLLPALLVIWFSNSKKVSDLIPLIFIPLGLLLVALLDYLYTGDALNFFHVQSSFGANRSGSNLVFLPQVIFRYIKIFATIKINSLAFFVAIQEFLFTIIPLGLILIFYKKLKLEYLILSFFVLITPTLTGTLSSMPRYVLAAFPLFFTLSESVKNKYIFGLISLAFFIIELANVILFANGYFVS